MNIPIRVTLGCAFIAVTSLAATSNSPRHLTAQRVLQLTTSSGSPAAQSYRVEISSLGKALLPSDKPEGEITRLQEAFFPTEFVPPQAAPVGSPVAIAPGTPVDFEKLQTGWTVRLHAKALGKLVVISGLANFVEAGSVPAAYGEVSTPVYTDHEDMVLVPNTMNMAKVQTTATRFQVFAIPGQNYEVTLYRGAKPEKHQISLALE